MTKIINDKDLGANMRVSFKSHTIHDMLICFRLGLQASLQEN